MFRARHLLLVVVACLLTTFASAQETERVHKVVPLGPGGTVRLTTFSGFVHVTGADVNQVTIDAVRRAERDRLDHIKLDVEASGNAVVIDANKKDENWHEKNNNVVETEFEIQVPREARLDIHSFSSPVTVAGVTAPQAIETFSGRIELHDAPAQVKAKTFSAPVDVTVAPAVSEPSFTVETFSGAIDLRMPPAARGRVEFNTFSGDMTSELPLTLQKQSRKHLIGDLGGGGNSEVQLKTFSGNVRILR
jgi:hypothetical protein